MVSNTTTVSLLVYLLIERIRRYLLVFFSIAVVIAVVFILSQLIIGRITLQFHQLHYFELLKFNFFWVNLLVILWAVAVMVWSLWKSKLNQWIDQSCLIVQAKWILSLWFSTMSANLIWFTCVVYTNLFKLFYSADKAKDLIFDNGLLTVIKRWSDSELLSLSNELFRLHSFDHKGIDIFLMIRNSNGSWDNLKQSIEFFINQALASDASVIAVELSHWSLLKDWLYDNRLAVGAVVGVIIIGGIIWYLFGGDPSEPYLDLSDLPGLPPEPGSLSGQLSAIDARLAAIESHPAIRAPNIPDFIGQLNIIGARLTGTELNPTNPTDLSGQLSAIDARLAAIESSLDIPGSLAISNINKLPPNITADIISTLNSVDITVNSIDELNMLISPDTDINMKSRFFTQSKLDPTMLASIRQFIEHVASDWI